MIPDLIYVSKGFYISNQIRSRPIYLSLGLSTIGLYIRNLYYLVNTLTSTDYSI